MVCVHWKMRPRATHQRQPDSQGAADRVLKQNCATQAADCHRQWLLAHLPRDQAQVSRAGLGAALHMRRKKYAGFAKAPATSALGADLKFEISQLKLYLDETKK